MKQVIFNINWDKATKASNNYWGITLFAIV